MDDGLPTGNRDEWMRRTGPLYPALVAIRQLTGLPLPVGVDATGADTARAAPWYPIIGAMLGGALALLAVIVGVTDLVPAITGLVVVVTAIAITGAMHETGLARTVDALFGGLPAAGGGSLGLPALLALLAAPVARAVLLLGIAPHHWPGALITSQVALRWAPVFVASIGDRLGEPADDEHVPRRWLMSRRVAPAALAIGTAFAAVPVVLFGGWAGLLALVTVAGAAFLAGLFLERRFGGLDPAALAAVGLLCELVTLLAFALFDPATASPWAS